MKIRKLLDMNSKYSSLLLIIFLFLISSIFLFKAFLNSSGPNGSVDLIQFYSLSKDFWSGKDIYENIEPGKTAMPMWNHLMYIIFYPFTLFSYEITKILWFGSNLIFTYIIIKLLKKAFSLNFNKSLILIIMIVSSTPFTNTLGNGQIGLFLLMSLLFYWYSNSKIKGIFLSTAYIKFSFAPFFLMNSLFKKEIDLIFAIIVSILAVLFYGIYINDLRFIEFFNPLLSILAIIKANKETFIGDINNFHIRALFSNLGFSQYYIWGMIILAFLNLVNIFLIKKNNDLLFLMISISSLLIFYHNYYDLVFLIPLAGYLLKSNTSNFIFFINFPIIIWFFYFVRFNELILDQYLSLNLMNIIGSVLLIISYLSLYIQNLKDSNKI